MQLLYLVLSFKHFHSKHIKDELIRKDRDVCLNSDNIGYLKFI